MDFDRNNPLWSFLVVGTSVAAFSSYVYHLFGNTIPSVFSVYLRDIGAALVMLAVFVFAITWMVKAKPHQRPKSYMLKVFDAFGEEFKLDGIRTEFHVYDVAVSFMKQYKKSYPVYNFALVSQMPNSQRLTIFRYI